MKGWFTLLLLVWSLVAPSTGQAWAQGRSVAVLIAVHGAASVRRSGAGSFIEAVRKMSLAGGDLARTGPNGRMVLLFDDGSQIKLNANTLLLIPTRTGRALPSRLGLSTGEVWARITKGRRVSIETPTAVAGVRGTELNLRVAEDQTATLSVAEGEVRFENERGSVVVREGEQSVARPGQAPTPPAAVNLPFIIQWTNDVQPVSLLLEVAFISQDPARLAALGGRGGEGARGGGGEGGMAIRRGGGFLGMCITTGGSWGRRWRPMRRRGGR